MEKSKKRTPKEKKLSGFSLAVIIYSLVLSVVICALLSVLASFLRTYENNLPALCAENYVSELDDESLAALIEKELGEISEYESGELILQRSPYLKGEIKQAKLAREYTSLRPVYRLICGENDVGRLVLRRAEKDAAFGIAAWEVDFAELYAEAIEGGEERRDIKVILPREASLKINGIPASPSDCEDSEYSGDAIVSKKDGECKAYLLSGLATEPILEAEYEGKSYALPVSGGKSDWFASEERSFMLTVPEGAEVTLDGERLKKEKAVKGEPIHIISEFEKVLGNKLPGSDSYRIFGDPESLDISVYLGGICLDGGEIYIDDEEKGREVSYLYAKAGLYSVKAVLPPEAELYINGIKAERSDKKVEYPSLSSVAYLAGKGATEGVLYEIGDLLLRPDVTAKYNGAEIPVSVESTADRALLYEFYGRVTEPDSAKLASADGFARAYFHYVANGAVGIEENYAALIGRMKSQSPGYKQIRSSKGSIEFVNQGVYRIDELSPRDFTNIGQNMFSCRIDFSVHLRFYRNEKQYEGVISLLFVREGDGYLVCDMSIDSES